MSCIYTWISKQNYFDRTQNSLRPFCVGNAFKCIEMKIGLHGLPTPTQKFRPGNGALGQNEYCFSLTTSVSMRRHSRKHKWLPTWCSARMFASSLSFIRVRWTSTQYHNSTSREGVAFVYPIDFSSTEKNVDIHSSIFWYSILSHRTECYFILKLKMFLFCRRHIIRYWGTQKHKVFHLGILILRVHRKQHENSSDFLSIALNCTLANCHIQFPMQIRN